MLTEVKKLSRSICWWAGSDTWWPVW